MTFLHNSDLYADPNLAEGVDYARRHRRHERFDDTLARTDDVPKTTILAPHGGGIKPGTSELCLAVAGYRKSSLPQVPPSGVTYDYWMFEGVRELGNAALHVPLDRLRRRRGRLAVRRARSTPLPCTASGRGAARLSPKTSRSCSSGAAMPPLRGVPAGRAGAMPTSTPGTRAGNGELDGNANHATSSTAPCARSWSPAPRCSPGARSWSSARPLREAMFTEHSRPRRKHTTTQLFWTFVAVCRDALDRLQETEQVGLTPVFRCPES